MYEVFLNERKLLVGKPSEFFNCCSQVRIVELKSFSDLADQVNRFLAGDEELLALAGDDPALWSRFKKLFQFIPAAGGVVRSEKGILLIFRRGKWDLPKGKTERHETAEMAALREVREETGLSGLVIDGALPSTWHLYLSHYPGKPEVWILKETRWFSMHSSGDQEPVPETGEEIQEVRWFTSPTLPQALANTHASLRELISGAFRPQS